MVSIEWGCVDHPRSGEHQPTFPSGLDEVSVPRTPPSQDRLDSIDSKKYCSTSGLNRTRDSTIPSQHGLYSPKTHAHRIKVDQKLYIELFFQFYPIAILSDGLGRIGMEKESLISWFGPDGSIWPNTCSTRSVGGSGPVERRSRRVSVNHC